MSVETETKTKRAPIRVNGMEAAGGKHATCDVWHHVCFAAIALLLLSLMWRLLRLVFLYSLRNQSASHIPLIPFIAFFLIFAARDRIFSVPTWSIRLGGVLTLFSALVCLWLYNRSLIGSSWSFSAASLSAVSAWIGAFSLCYGVRATRVALFPLLLLLFIVPWPDPVLSRVVHVLQQGSAEISYLLFRAVGVPVLKRGFYLSVPGVTIQVAEECSSIRSSIALLVTCLLAAHFYLRRYWTTLLFIALAISFSVVKNGIRIATLTLLSVYVDPSFLTGRLHQDGGVLFFLLALVMLWPLLLLLGKLEKVAVSGISPAS